MGFKKGQSGNPAGKKLGTSHQKKFRDMIASEIPSLVETEELSQRIGKLEEQLKDKR